MKASIWIVISMVCLTCSAMAELEQRVGPFLTGMASVGDESGSAFGGGAKYECLFNPNFGLDVHVGYLTDGDIGLIPVALGPIAVIPLDPVSLTLGAGALYGIPSEGGADPALGFYAAVGVRGPATEGMEWFVEAQYVDVKGDDNSETTYTSWSITRTSSEKLDFSAVGLNLGVLWKF